MARKTINVDYLARVEGEGGVKITFDGSTVRDVELRIFEPPRFFEAFLRGRAYTEAPDITARICGICPVAYQMSAVHAMEDALGVTVTPEVRELRRLLYCGEWIESHTLHIYMLHAPDFLGYHGAIEMAKDHGDIVRQGLELKKIGNEILELLGGRAIHPVNVRVGGFYRAPSRRELRTLVEPLQRARDIALSTVRWVSGFDFPDCERDYEFVSLGAAGEYPFNAGHVVSNKGLDITPHEYDAHFEELHVKRSNALHSHLRGRPYLTGPIARYSLNSALLSPLARDAAKQAGLGDLQQSVPQHRGARGGGAVRLRRGAADHRCVSGAGAAASRSDAARRCRLCLHRGAARHAVSPLPAGCGRHHPGCQDRAADVAEPAEHRGRPEGVRRRLAGYAGGGAAGALRAGGAQPRSVHLVRDAFPEAGSGAWVTAWSSASAIPIAATMRSAG